MRFMKLVSATILTVSMCTAAQAEEAHSHDFPQAVDDYHTAMSPAWHMPEGQERLDYTCEVSLTLVEKAQDVVDAFVKTTTENLALDLLSSSKELFGGCEGKADVVEMDLIAVHDAFHKLIESFKK